MSHRPISIVVLSGYPNIGSSSLPAGLYEPVVQVVKFYHCCVFINQIIYDYFDNLFDLPSSLFEGQFFKNDQLCARIEQGDLRMLSIKTCTMAWPQQSYLYPITGLIKSK